MQITMMDEMSPILFLIYSHVATAAGGAHQEALRIAVTTRNVIMVTMMMTKVMAKTMTMLATMTTCSLLESNCAQTSSVSSSSSGDCSELA